LRFKNLRQKEAQKVMLAGKMGELEQMALRSQMNPHFIFNSLNSIQHYVIDKDILGANEFITHFSRLIRLTLDISSKLDISIEQEIIYYIEKIDISEEQVRLKNHCDYFRDVLMDHAIVKGKKLSFILQEIGREINTTGSKAYDSDIQKCVVLMKDELEKAKEQILNVL